MPRGSLREYHAKRDFARTAEPKGAVGRQKASKLRYLIQKHAARALHYDFRLEWNGVLMSWAVPRGPSEDPDDKRLAVRTEDHPIDYGDFEGTIPEGRVWRRHRHAVGRRAPGRRRSPMSRAR